MPSITYIKNRGLNGPRLKPGTYDKYIQYCKHKFILGQKTEKHHIIPRHSGGSKESTNVVFLLVKDHILAHLLPYLEKGNKADLTAYIFRKATFNIDLKNHGKKMAYLNQQKQTGFWDSKTQSILGKRGGRKGGLAKTDCQQKSRSIIGKKWGLNVGLKNQSDLLKNRLKSKTFWIHKNFSEHIIELGPCNSVLQIVEQINQQCINWNRLDLCLDINKVRLGGAFYSLVKGDKKSAYGWSVYYDLDA